MLLGRDSISDNILWSVGDGTSIKIRKDRWLQKGVIGGPAPQDEPELVADFIIPEQNTWNGSLLCQSFDKQTVEEIVSIPLRTQFTKDRVIWQRK